MRLNIHRFIPISIIALAACLAACSPGNSAKYAKFVNISSAGWAENEYCEFTPVTDSIFAYNPKEKYNLVLAVRYADNYPFADLYLNIASNAPLPADRRLNLFKGNRWQGQASYGLITFTDTLAKAITLPPDLNIKISPAMNRPLVGGIMSVGIIISPAK